MMGSAATEAAYNVSKVACSGQNRDAGMAAPVTAASRYVRWVIQPGP